MHIRYYFVLSLCFLSFLLWKWLSFWIRSNKKKLFIVLDYLLNFAVIFAFSFRPRIDSRDKGNFLYIISIVLWALIKVCLVLTLLDFKELKKDVIRGFKNTKGKIKTISWKQRHNLNLYLIGSGIFFSSLTYLLKDLPKGFLLLAFFYASLFISLLWVVDTLLKIFKVPKQDFILTSLMCASLVLVILDTFNYSLLSIHMSESLKALFAQGLSQINSSLEGADVRPVYFYLLSLFFLILPFIGSYLLSKLPSKKVSLSIFWPFLFISLNLSGLIFTEKHLSHSKKSEPVRELAKRVSPYCVTLKPQKNVISVSNWFKPKLIEQTPRRDIAKTNTPHIFLIVIESYRKDLLNEKTSPFMTSFKSECLPFKVSASNSNVTHCSLFSLFHSLYPNHWLEYHKQKGSKGALPLRILKEQGYQLHAFHSSFFRYFEMTDSLFGSKAELLNTLYEAKHKDARVAYRDVMAIEQLESKLKDIDPSTPQFMTLLLDSTHHHYYWTDDFDPPFTPYLKSFNYANRSRNQLMRVKNRYLNSLLYVDGLIERFCAYLKKLNLYDDSIIIITGDHGEEFMESGHYFHGTDLCLEQSLVPIFIKMPISMNKEVLSPQVSHVDLFPSLFDYLNISYSQDAFEGKSIFKSKYNPILSFKPDNLSIPHEFYWYDGETKVDAKLISSIEEKNLKIEVDSIEELSPNFRAQNKDLSLTKFSNWAAETTLDH